MIELLTDKYFQFLAIPLATTFLVIFVKSASRNDKQAFLEKEDFAFGLEMVVTALLLLLGNSVNIAQKVVTDENYREIATDNLLTMAWVAPLIIVGLWGMSTLVRRVGWEKEDGKEKKLKWHVGILIPDLFGLLVLIYVVSTLGN